MCLSRGYVRGCITALYTASVAHPQRTVRPFLLVYNSGTEMPWRRKLTARAFVGNFTVAFGSLLRSALAVAVSLAVAVFVVAGYDSAAADFAADGAQPLAVDELAESFTVAWHHVTQMCFQTVLTKAPCTFRIFTGKH